jgi:hypothetical protein
LPGIKALFFKDIPIFFMTLRHWLSESRMPVRVSMRAATAFAFATGEVVKEQIKHCQNGSKALDGRY